MADDNKSSDPERDIEMEELREELARLKEALGDRLEQVRAVVDERVNVVRDNPATFSAALVIGGIVGLFVGMAVGQSDRRAERWFDRYR